MTRRLPLLAALVASLLVNAACAVQQQNVANGTRGQRAQAESPPRQQAVPPHVTAYRDVQYVSGGHPRQNLDLYIKPSAEPAALIILIHGGAYTGGDKGEMNPMPFIADGFAVASINYRLSQDAVFPAQIEDCKAAVRWLRRNATQYHIDPERIGVWGTSAGGHLAALLGTSGETRIFDVGENLEVASAVQAVADWFGPTDFLQLEAAPGPRGRGPYAAELPVARLFGRPVHDDPAAARRASPITYITPRTPPFLIAHGDADTLVPHQQSELLAAALKKSGIPMTLYTVPGAGHGFRDAAAEALRRDFFIKYLQPAARK